MAWALGTPRYLSRDGRGGRVIQVPTAQRKHRESGSFAKTQGKHREFKKLPKHRENTGNLEILPEHSEFGLLKL